jgi:hypothetical protein
LLSIFPLSAVSVIVRKMAIGFKFGLNNDRILPPIGARRETSFVQFIRDLDWIITHLLNSHKLKLVSKFLI